MGAVVGTVVVLIIIVLLLMGTGLRQVQQYQRGVVLRFGRLLPAIRQPGLRAIIPAVDNMTKVPIQTVVLDVPSQGAITRDNVTVGVDAVVYFRVEDPVKAVVNVENYMHATSQVAQTSLRSVIGRADLDTLLTDRQQVNAELRGVIDTPTEDWGIKVDRVEIKDISLPEGMRRSMSRQAEAERDRRARVIAADSEYQASTKLHEAASAMEGTPGALQLRLLQTVVDVAAEKNSTLVMPLPVEMLRFFEQMQGGAAAGEGAESAGEATAADGAQGKPNVMRSAAARRDASDLSEDEPVRPDDVPTQSQDEPAPRETEQVTTTDDREDRG